MRKAVRLNHLAEAIVVLIVLIVVSILSIHRFFSAQTANQVVALHLMVSELLQAQVLYNSENRDTERTNYRPFIIFSQHHFCYRYPGINHLTTPVSYLKQIPVHPFHKRLQDIHNLRESNWFQIVDHVANIPFNNPQQQSAIGSTVIGRGPDGERWNCSLFKRFILDGVEHWSVEVSPSYSERIALPLDRHYDPSNGLFSSGCILEDSRGRQSSGFRLVH